MNYHINDKKKYLENINTFFLKYSKTINKHLLYQMNDDKNSIILPIFNSEKAILLKKEEKIHDVKNLLHIPLDSHKEITCNSSIVFEIKKHLYNDMIYPAKKIGKNLAITFDSYFFSKINDLQNNINIKEKKIQKEKIPNFKLGRSIIDILRMISTKNKFISNQDWHFYTSSEFFLSILHSLKLEKVNYNNEIIKKLLKHFTGFDITVIASHLINSEKNNTFLIGFFHHEISIGTIRKEIKVEKEIIKFDLETEILTPNNVGTIKLINN